MRLFFGLWLLYVGASKWLVLGANSFVAMIVSDFDKTWSPHSLNAILAWIIIIAEPALAILILSGFKARAAWMLTACLMFLLLMGQTILMKGDVLSNWMYVILTLVCAALSDPISGFFSRGPVVQKVE